MAQEKKIGLKVRQVGRPHKKKVSSEDDVKPTVKKRGRPRKTKSASKTRTKKTAKKESTKKSSLKKSVKKTSVFDYQAKPYSADDIVEELVMNNELHLQTEMRRKKIMWLSVSVIMFLIVGFWFYNLKNSLPKNELSTTLDTTAFSDIKNVTDTIEKQLAEIKSSLAKIDEFTEESDDYFASSTSGSFPREGVSSTLILLPDEDQASTSEEIQ